MIKMPPSNFWPLCFSMIFCIEYSTAFFFALLQPSPLFTKIEESRAQALKKRYAGKRILTSTPKKELDVKNKKHL